MKEITTPVISDCVIFVVSREFYHSVIVHQTRQELMEDPVTMSTLQSPDVKMPLPEFVVR